MSTGRPFIRFHGKHHLSELGPGEVAALLTHVAVGRGAAPSTRNDAKSAILLLCRDMLELQLPWFDEVVASVAPTPTFSTRRCFHANRAGLLAQVVDS